jgi:hypothetical protein
LGCYRSSSRFCHAPQHSLLVTGVTADGSDQIGHQVVSAPEQDIDVAPRAVHAVAAPYEPVVPDDAEHHERERNPDDHQDWRRHLPSRRLFEPSM